MCLLVVSPGNVFAKKVDQTTDKVNQSLRISNDKGDIDEYKATVAEVLVTKNEALAMQQLSKLLKKYRGTPLEPGLLFRQAELYVRQAKSARFFEFSRSDNNLVTMIPAAMKNATSKGKLTRAVEIYEEIQRRYPHYSELDAVYFNNAFLRQQLSQEKVAEKLYKALLKDFPESILVPDTHLAIAEMFYQQRRYQEALPEYEAIKKYPGARVYPYAIYKGGWNRYQLKDVVGAIHELEFVIQLSQSMSTQENAKLNLKNEALNDLVLFYPEAYQAKNAFAYFKKWAGDEAGKYLVSLSQMYERHSNFKDLETVLNDLITSLPLSPETPVAYKSILENDVNSQGYEKASSHLARFETHCLKYFPQDSLVVAAKPANAVQKDEESDKESLNCFATLTKESLRIAVKWHKKWQSRVDFFKKENALKKEQESLNAIASATELAYGIYLRNTPIDAKQSLVRYNYAELLFQRKTYRLASDEYFKTAQNTQDAKILHQSSYYAIVSLESAVQDKWSDQDEDRYTVLAKSYIDKNPNGQYINDIRFKKAFIAYEKGRYDEAAPEFKKIGWGKAPEKLALKSQDLYLDILNIQKKYKDIVESTESLLKQNVTSDRKRSLTKLNQESNFSYALVLEKGGDWNNAISVYDQFVRNNQESPLADKAQWNMIQILIKQNNIKMAADKSLMLYRLFPSSSYVKDSLKKAAELYEFLADTKGAATSLKYLAKIDQQNNLKWLKLSGDFFILSNDFKEGLDIYKEVLKAPNEKVRAEIVSSLVRIEDSKIYSSRELHDLILKYGGEKYSEDSINKARLAFESKKMGEAFKLASQIVGDKKAPYHIQAQARFIQAEILKDEFMQQSVKTKVDRIQMVLTLKTEKLDKAQRAFQSTIKYGDPTTSLKSFYSLALMYEHYVEAMRSIKITDDISEKDKKLLMSEIDQIVIPIEEKVADTLQQGIDFAKKYPTYDGYAFLLRNELNKVNFKGLKFVQYEVLSPKVIMPRVE